MARVRMVTRTVTVSKVMTMCVNITNAEVSVQNYTMTGEFDDLNSALKAVKKLYETDTFKCVAVQAITKEEVLYGMTEVEFIKMAKVLPPRSGNTEE